MLRLRARSFLHSDLKFKNRRPLMSVPTFGEIKQRIAPVWENEEYKRDVLWAGIFGSVARNRAHAQSDVDILIVLKEHERSGEPIDLRENLVEACGRDISFMCIWQGPDWAWGHVRLEALLSSRTVYGNRIDIEHLRREAMAFIADGNLRFSQIAESVDKIKKQVSTVPTYEEFTQPALEHVRKVCVLELQKIVRLLDIKPLHHPIRTMLIPFVFEYAEQARATLDQIQLEATPGTVPVWKEIWDYITPTSYAMWSFDTGCATGGRAYLRHVLASKKLADRFEEGGQVDDAMYKDILR
ncbi:hypothetical protein D9756_010319 [Leucocoprinus leucothites]|uniref:Polymerase beta nucleotidyltransferase domain-containing protein n=1 Tax=Leucocoprinus leucothites TaxID=201217 RepID=A0A8H5CTQ7_9AGAR|nr:hypothetical protein D9756_010319 [Leucoagaricus leucothites]